MQFSHWDVHTYVINIDIACARLFRISDCRLEFHAVGALLALYLTDHIWLVVSKESNSHSPPDQKPT